MLSFPTNPYKSNNSTLYDNNSREDLEDCSRNESPLNFLETINNSSIHSKRSMRMEEVL